MTAPAICPACESAHVRRGGARTWIAYMVILAVAVPAVLLANLHAGLVAAISLVLVVLTHLIVGERVCLDCGTQWRSGEGATPEG